MVSPSLTIRGQSGIIKPVNRSAGISLAVNTRRTPSIFSALAVLIFRTLALGCSLNFNAPCTIPSNFRSATYGASPTASLTESYFGRLSPTFPLYFGSSRFPLFLSASAAVRHDFVIFL